MARLSVQLLDRCLGGRRWQWPEELGHLGGLRGGAGDFPDRDHQELRHERQGLSLLAVEP